MKAHHADLSTGAEGCWEPNVKLTLCARQGSRTGTHPCSEVCRHAVLQQQLLVSWAAGVG